MSIDVFRKHLHRLWFRRVRKMEGQGLISRFLRRQLANHILRRLSYPLPSDYSDKSECSNSLNNGKIDPTSGDLSGANHEFADVNGRVVLITSLYFEKNRERELEYLECLQRNLESGIFHHIHVFYDTSSDGAGSRLLNFIQNSGIGLSYIEGRLTYSDIFSYANESLRGQLVVIANGDIYFNETLERAKAIDLQDIVLAITRWDELSDGNIILRDHLTSRNSQKGGLLDETGGKQDAWIFRAPLRLEHECPFPLGTLYCDGFLNFQLLKSERVRVYNPCLDIQCCHLHKSDIRAADLIKTRSSHGEFVWSMQQMGFDKCRIDWCTLKDILTERKKIKAVVGFDPQDDSGQADAALDALYSRDEIDELHVFYDISRYGNNLPEVLSSRLGIKVWYRDDQRGVACEYPDDYICVSKPYIASIQGGHVVWDMTELFISRATVNRQVFANQVSKRLYLVDARHRIQPSVLESYARDKLSGLAVIIIPANTSIESLEQHIEKTKSKLRCLRQTRTHDDKRSFLE
jgi:hypothetical protein